jgi:hypothetical protein
MQVWGNPQWGGDLTLKERKGQATDDCDLSMRVNRMKVIVICVFSIALVC